MTVKQEQFGRVAVLFGGTSAEREISLISGQAVLDALKAGGIDAEAFDPARRPIAEVVAYDRAFIVLHGRGGEDGTVQGALELLGVPYTGSGVLASALGMDKARTKQLWLGCGLPTPSYRRLSAETDFASVVTELGLPLMIKPVREGSSIGMRKVESLEDLPGAYAFAAQYDSEIIAERWITGREYTIVILGGRALPVIRLQPHQSHGFYDFEAKYQANDTQYLHRFELTNPRKGQEKYIYTYSEAEYRRKLAELTKKGQAFKEPQRYKGLGEMDADQLKDTTMDPQHRTLRRITVEEGEALDNAVLTFEKLMGNDVAPRKEFIVAGAYQLDSDRIDA